MLPGEVAARHLVAEGGAPAEHLQRRDVDWPSAHRVRLDAATGIVVGLEQLDGAGAGGGWSAVVEAVDEP